MDYKNTAKVKRAWIVLLVGAMLMGFLFVSAALAATITVDGDPSDWPGDDSATHILGTPSCTIGTAGCSLIATDLDEPDPPPDTNIRDIYDIEQVWFTNNATTGYFRIDTYDNIDLITPPFGNSEIKFCIDEDQDNGTGAGISGCDDTGVECLITLTNDSTVDVFDLELATQSTGSHATGTRFLEVSFAMADCNLTNGSYNAEVFFNNGTTDGDDTVPDNAAFQIDVPGPTYISLEQVNARTQPSRWLVFGFAGMFLVAVAALFGRRFIRSESS